MESSEQVETARVEYERGALDESNVDPDPFAQFERWLSEALRAETREPYAMTLATAGADGMPSARIVLLRGFDRRGLSFFTNYESRKGHELAERPAAALLFYWPALERQVRVEGAVERLEPGESDAYFSGRPRGHRLGAWASPQSAGVPGRPFLEERVREAEERFAGREVDRPPHWGGYRVVPRTFEFWQGRPNRVHDRILYERTAGGWRIGRLAP